MGYIYNEEVNELAMNLECEIASIKDAIRIHEEMGLECKGARYTSVDRYLLSKITILGIFTKKGTMAMKMAIENLGFDFKINGLNGVVEFI
ncbi:MAG: hypothetical protein ACRC5M_06885 [Anaeroplasmataceae bacterium]